MITIYTTCRSFENPKFALIQRNAIMSWLQLDPKPEIIVVGDDPGAAQFCHEQNLIHIKDVETRENNCPVVSDMIKKSEAIASNKIMLLLCSDMIVFQDTVEAAKRLSKKFSVFCGGVHRKDREMDYLIDFNDKDWAEKARQNTKLGHPGAGDYFLHTKGLFNDMPPFTVGRASCDNWIYWKAHQQKCLVNLSPVVEVVHQNHDHSHMIGGNIFANPEFKINRNLAQGKAKVIAEANWVMDKHSFIHKG